MLSDKAPQEFEKEGWLFYHRALPMMDTKMLLTCQQYADSMAKERAGATGGAQEEEEAPGKDSRLIQSMPEMYFGQSRLFILNPTLNVAISFSPFEALS